MYYMSWISASFTVLSGITGSLFSVRLIKIDENLMLVRLEVNSHYKTVTRHSAGMSAL